MIRKSVFSNLLFLLVLYCHWSTSVEALRCYSCSAQIEPRDPYSECENFYPNSDEAHKTTDCPYPDSVCGKHIVNIEGKKWVHRNCQHSNICSVLQLRHRSLSDQVLECSTCMDKDLCNSSTKSQPIFAPILLIIIATYSWISL